MQLSVCLVVVCGGALLSAAITPLVRYLNDDERLPLFSVSSNLCYLAPALLAATHWQEVEVNAAIAVVMVDLIVSSTRWHLNIIEHWGEVVKYDYMNMMNTAIAAAVVSLSGLVQTRNFSGLIMVALLLFNGAWRTWNSMPPKVEKYSPKDRTAVLETTVASLVSVVLTVATVATRVEQALVPWQAIFCVVSIICTAPLAFSVLHTPNSRIPTFEANKGWTIRGGELLRYDAICGVFHAVTALLVATSMQVAGPIDTSASADEMLAIGITTIVTSVPLVTVVALPKFLWNSQETLMAILFWVFYSVHWLTLAVEALIFL